MTNLIRYIFLLEASEKIFSHYDDDDTFIMRKRGSLLLELHHHYRTTSIIMNVNHRIFTFEMKRELRRTQNIHSLQKHVRTFRFTLFTILVFNFDK